MSTDILVLDKDTNESGFREQVMFKELRGLNHGESREAWFMKKINIKETVTTLETTVDELLTKEEKESLKVNLMQV